MLFGRALCLFKWYLVFLLCLFVFHHYPVINKTVNHNKFRFGYIVTFMLVFKQYFGFKWRHCTTVHFFVYSKSKLFLFVGNPFCSFPFHDYDYEHCPSLCKFSNVWRGLSIYTKCHDICYICQFFKLQNHKICITVPICLILFMAGIHSWNVNLCYLYSNYKLFYKIFFLIYIFVFT